MVEREIGMAQLDGVLPVIGAVADVADQDILVTAAERYSVLRRFSSRFLAAFDFRSNRVLARIRAKSSHRRLAWTIVRASDAASRSSPFLAVH